MASVELNNNWKPKYNPWLISVVVALAAFMEVLDTSIANVALPHIAGGLGTSVEQGTWVLTTYLVANAIVLPITGWITSALGRKRFFIICIVLFTLASFLCGIAPSLPFLLFARALQGAGGGGMQPMAQAIMADSFPPRLRSMAFALFGVTVVVAPALGPTLGGWITDSYSWRWIFLINIPVGVVALSLISQLVEDPPFLRRFKPGEIRFDYIGFSMLVLGVGALQILLDKGQEDDWLASHFIAVLAVIAVVCLTLLVLWEWYEKHPIVDVKLFKLLNFSGSNLVIFFAGVTTFASIVLMPQFLQQLMGYTAQQAGLVVSVGAALLLLTMPLLGILTARFPAKYLIAFGWLASAIVLYYTTQLLSMGVSFGTAALVMLIQNAPVAFIFIPAMTACFLGVPQEKTDSVTGLSNFVRNIGSSIGASLVQTVLARRSQFHIARLADHTGVGDTNFITQTQGLAAALHMRSAGVGIADAQGGALAQVYQFLAAQAATLAYLDVYFLMGAASVVMLLLSFFLKSNDPKHTEQHAAH